MKIRYGYVSNSSSSSFVCSVCGYVDGGYDYDPLEDFGVMFCEYGHCFCVTHMTPEMQAVFSEKSEVSVDLIKRILESKMKHTKSQYTKEDLSELLEDEKWLKDAAEDPSLLCDLDLVYECPPVVCPICSFKEFEANNALEFLMKKHGYTAQSLLEEISGQFSSYSEFLSFLKEKNQ